MSLKLKPYKDYKNTGLQWLEEIPEHWDMIKTKRLFRLCTEKAPANHGLELLSIYTHIGVKPRKELEERGNKASSTDEYWIVKHGDIIVNKLLAWMGAVGVSHYEGVTSPAYDILRRIRPLNPDFYHYLFRTGIYLREFKSRSRGIMDPAFTSSALAFGSAVHEAVAAFHQQHMLGDTLRPDEMLDVYRQAWTKRNDEEIRFCNGDNQASLQEKASQVLTVYHESFDPSIEVLGIEEFFEVQITDTVPPFQGYIDLIEQGQGGNVTVVDLKTAARKLSNGQSDSNLQLTTYSIGAQSLGFDPDQLMLRLDVVTKTKTPELVRYETTRNEPERERFCKLVTNVWNATERETWFPRQDWHCTNCAWAEPCTKW